MTGTWEGGMVTGNDIRELKKTNFSKMYYYVPKDRKNGQFGIRMGCAYLAWRGTLNERGCQLNGR